MNRNDKVAITYGLLVDTADAIRSKKGTSSLIDPSDFPSEVESISGDSSPIKLSMSFKNNTPSIAYGEIVLSAKEAEYSGNYDIMWGDANGVMSNYSKIDTLTLDVANNKTMASINKLIEFNAIPKYATRLCAVQNGTIVTDFDIPNAKLWASGNFGDKIATYIILADGHVQYNTGATDTQVAITYGKEREDCDAIFFAGDLTSNGTVANLEEWKTIRDTYRGNTPVYSCVGNHEAYNASSIMATNPSAIRKYLDSDWVDETETSFVKIINNDVFIFVSIFDGTYQKKSNTMLNETTLTWLEGVLEQYRNQRCFLFMHVPPHWETTGIKYNGFGNGNGAYSYDIWGNPVDYHYPQADRTAFLNLLDHYKNVIWFSGHSHIKYEYQKIWDSLNVMQYKGGARFVHVSSLTVPRDIIDGSVSDYIYAESEGAVMDVYTNVVRVRCRNFVGEKFYGLCEYLIDTTPVTIPSKSKTLVSISAVKTKTSYYTDESLSTSDITVTATWSDSTTSVVDNSDVVFDTSNVTLATEGTYTIGISYTYGDDTETTSVQVTSTTRPSVKTLASIAASKTTTAYTVNDTLSTADITAVATYSDTTTANIANGNLSFDTSNVDMTTAGAYTIEVSYTEDGVKATTTVGITVSSSSVNPTIILDASYTGTLNQAGAEPTNVTINDSHGSVKGASNHEWTYSDDANAIGKTLYYRMLSNVGSSQAGMIGVVGGTGTKYYGPNGQTNDSFSLSASDWTVLKDDSNNPMVMNATNKFITFRYRCSSSSTETFPVTLNARLQIGYVD